MMKVRDLLLGAAAVAALLVGVPAEAASAGSWAASTAEDFARGTLDGTALDERGRIRIAPELATLWGPDAGVVWALAPAADGAAFVALSGPGRVLRVAAGREAEVWYEAPDESLVTSLAPDGSGGVLFGVSPGGRVLHARADRSVETFAELDGLFVWALDRDEGGTLWAATGIPGRILRVRPDGDVERVFESGDDPIRSLAALPDGGVLAGTGGRGRVLRVDARGRAFVLLDADETEVVSVAAGADGEVYALVASGIKQPSSPNGPSPDPAETPGSTTVRVVARAPDGEEDDEGSEPERAPPVARPGATFRGQPGGALYRIDADGTWRRIWESASEMPFALTRGADGRLLVATGDEGRVHAVDADGRAASLLRVRSDQASAMSREPDGSILVGGTTDARVERLGPGPGRDGRYLTPAVDAGGPAVWGRLVWRGEVPRGSAIRVHARSGNTDEPDSTWSDWVAVEPGPDGRGGSANVPVARWFQARFELESGDRGSPALHGIEVAYRARNRGPVVQELSVEPPGIAWIVMPTQSSTMLGPVVADDPVSRRAADSLQRGGRGGVPIRRAWEAGSRTFSWKAEDPDGDRVRYAIDVRADGDEAWYPLARDLDGEFFTWDARGMPDGFYRVRLTVSDAPDNPEGDGAHAERVSDAFHLDSRPPEVGPPAPTRTASGWDVAFEAHDRGGVIAAVEVSVDGAPWRGLVPLDGVADSETEAFRLTLDGTDARALMLRAIDASGNVAARMLRLGSDAPREK